MNASNARPAGPLVRIRISQVIADEYEIRQSARLVLPISKLCAGWCELTLVEVRNVAADAERNSDPAIRASLSTSLQRKVFSAYRALAKQARAAIRAVELAQEREIAATPSPGGDDITEPYRKVFESQARCSFGFKRSHKGNYINPSTQRDWKWFQAGLRACIATRSKT